MAVLNLCLVILTVVSVGEVCWDLIMSVASSYPASSPRPLPLQLLLCPEEMPCALGVFLNCHCGFDPNLNLLVVEASGLLGA